MYYSYLYRPSPIKGQHPPISTPASHARDMGPDPMLICLIPIDSHGASSWVGTALRAGVVCMRDHAREYCTWGDLIRLNLTSQKDITSVVFLVLHSVDVAFRTRRRRRRRRRIWIRTLSTTSYRNCDCTRDTSSLEQV